MSYLFLLLTEFFYLCIQHSLLLKYHYKTHKRKLEKRGYNLSFHTTHKCFVINKLHNCKKEGPLQGARTCPSRGKKGVFYEQEGRLLHACKASSKIKRGIFFTIEGVNIEGTEVSLCLHPSVSTIVQHCRHAANKRLIARLY